MEKRKMQAVRIGLLIAAVILIGIGIRFGGGQTVLAKAVRICTECVGLG